LDNLQTAMGGYIERVPFFDKYEGKPCVAFCSEEGKIEHMQPNYPATLAWVHALRVQGKTLGTNDGRMVDFLVGSIAIVTGDQGVYGQLVREKNYERVFDLRSQH
jgi:Domain of unknown function (DUF3846)